jgi:hypothetical protein
MTTLTYLVSATFGRRGSRIAGMPQYGDAVAKESQLRRREEAYATFGR